MYFPLFELHGWGYRSGVQPQTIDSEFPLYLLNVKKPSLRPPLSLKLYNTDRKKQLSEEVCRMEELVLILGIVYTFAVGYVFVRKADRLMRKHPQAFPGRQRVIVAKTSVGHGLSDADDRSQTV